MSGKWNRCWVIGLAGMMALLLAFGGSAMADKDKKESAEEGWLGIYIQNIDEDLQEAWDLPTDDGVIVSDVVKDSPAEKSGLEEGDVIVKYDGKTVTSTGRLTRMTRRSKPDTEVKLDILRDGKSQELTVTIGKREDDADFGNDDENMMFFGTPRGHLPRIDMPRIPPPPDGRFSIPGVDVYRFGLRGRIGIQMSDLNKQLGDYFGVEDGKGVLIEKVLKDSPAEKADLRAGDVIIGIGGDEVYETEDIFDEIGDLDGGENVELTVLRKGTKKNVTVTLEDNEDWAFPEDDERIIIRESRRIPRVRGYSWFDKDDTDIPAELGEGAERELREAIEELRKDLREVKKELRETQKELGDG